MSGGLNLTEAKQKIDELKTLTKEILGSQNENAKAMQTKMENITAQINRLKELQGKFKEHIEGLEQSHSLATELIKSTTDIDELKAPLQEMKTQIDNVKNFNDSELEEIINGLAGLLPGAEAGVEAGVAPTANVGSEEQEQMTYAQAASQTGGKYKRKQHKKRNTHKKRKLHKKRKTHKRK
jgi:chromosome segregation ATPase